MRLSLASRLALAIAVLTALPSAALAQIDYRNSLSGTYMFATTDDNGYHGFGVDYNRDIRTRGDSTIRLVVQYNYYLDDFEGVSVFAGGLQFACNAHERFVPYGEVTFGVIHQYGADPVLMYGGGVDIKLNNTESWRIRTSAGLVTSFGSEDTQTQFRFTGGMQFRF